MDAEVEHALGDVGGVAVAGGRRELVVEGAVRHVEVDPLGEVVRVEYRLRGRVREPLVAEASDVRVRLYQDEPVARESVNLPDRVVRLERLVALSFVRLPDSRGGEELGQLVDDADRASARTAAAVGSRTSCGRCSASRRTPCRRGDRGRAGR